MSALSIPGEADGLTKSESESLAFLARAGAVPNAAAFRAGDDRPLSAADAVNVKADELSASQIETTAFLARAGFVRGADATYVPGEADGLNRSEADTMAFLARAGLVPSARPASPIPGSNHQVEGFNR